MSRLAEAYTLAAKCWGKASRVSPTFVENYLKHSESLLTNHEEITGDMCKDYCVYNGTTLPKELHHNTWVSGVRTLYLLGWMTPVGEVVPNMRHNHMNTVTKWKSCIYKVGSGGVVYPYTLPLF